MLEVDTLPPVEGGVVGNQAPPGRGAPAARDRAWQDLLAARLRQDSTPDKEARKLASVILSALEGAMILCRTQRSTEPLRSVAEHLVKVA